MLVEEWVCYIYGVLQELLCILLDVDGVMFVYVYVVIFENDLLVDKVKFVLVVVYICYWFGVNFIVMVLMVKDFVVYSIEGLSYDNVLLFLQGVQFVLVDV